MRLPKCKECKKPFTRRTSTQVVCSFECSIAYGRKQSEKKTKKEYREAKIKAKSRGDWMREAQSAFNAYIRIRDRGKPCISSGIAWSELFQAGHYLATSIRPELRFNEDNVHAQSIRDNLHLHGNLIGYRKGLIDRIGIERVEWLEGPHEPAKYTIQDLQEIKQKYLRMARELRRNNGRLQRSNRITSRSC